MNVQRLMLCATLALFASSAIAQPTIDPGKLGPNTVNPTIKQDLQKEALPEHQKKAIKHAVKPRTRVQRGSLSVYAVPFDTWCAKTSEGTTGRATLVYDWPGESNTTTLDINFIVRTATGRLLTQRQRIYGGRTGVELISGTPLNFAHNDICPTGCVDARMAPINPGDANRLDQRWIRVCQGR